MRVGVDARHLDAGRGIAVYLQGMLGALTEDAVSLLVPGRAPLGPAARELAARPNVRVVRTRAPGRAVHGAAASIGVPTVAHLLGDDLDVVWIPALAPVSPGDVPYVVTVHDRSFEERPGDFTAYERLWHAAARPRRLARRAARVVTDTAAVRDEVRAAWGLERVTVVAPGVRPVAPRDVPEAEYVLFVGALEPRKDPVALARAAATAGVAAWFAGTGRLADDVQAAGGRLLGRVSDAELDGLLAGALALVLPSHLEGFGFPPLEAALCGTPSIVSDLPVLRETLGDGGAVFVPSGRSGRARCCHRAAARRPGAAGDARRAGGRARPRPHVGARGARAARRPGRGRGVNATLLVVLHDSEPDLEVLLRSIERHLPTAPELVVVDSGSSDGGAALAERHGARVVRMPGNPGFGAANVAGLEHVRTPVTVLLNPDVELLDDGLSRLVELAAARDALVVPRLLNADGSVQRSAHPEPGTARALVPALVHPRLLPRRLRLRGRSLAVGRAAARRLGDRRGRGGEDRHAAPAGAVRPRRVPLLRGPRAVPACRRRRRAHRAAPRDRAAPLGRPQHRPGLRRRAPRAAGAQAPGGRRHAPGSPRARARRPRAGRHVRVAGDRAPRA